MAHNKNSNTLSDKIQNTKAELYDKWSHRYHLVRHPISSEHEAKAKIKKQTIQQYYNGDFNEKYTPTQGMRETGHLIASMPGKHQAILIIVIVLIVIFFIFSFLS